MRVVSGRNKARSSRRNAPPASPASAQPSSPGRSARCSPCGGVVTEVSAWQRASHGRYTQRTVRAAQPPRRLRAEPLAPCAPPSRCAARTAQHISSCMRAAAHEESKAASAQGAALASSPHALFPSEASSPARRLGPRAAAPGWGTSSAPLSSAPRACARTEPRVSAHSRSRLHSPERRRTAAQARAPATHPQPPPCPPAASNCARSGVLASNSKERYH